MTDVTEQFKAAVEGQRIQPVLIMSIDIDNDPFYAWTGPGIFAPSSTGDTALDGKQFTPISRIISISDFVENQQSGVAMTISAMANDLDEPMLRQIVRDRRAWHGRPVLIWIGFLDTDNVSVVPNPLRVKTGILSNISIDDGVEGGIVSVTVDADLGGATGRGMKIKDHGTLWNNEDTFGSYVQELINQPKGIEGLYNRGTSSSGGGYRGIDDDRYLVRF